MSDLIEGRPDDEDDGGSTTEPSSVTINPLTSATGSGSATTASSSSTTDGDPTTDPRTTGESSDDATTTLEPTTTTEDPTAESSDEGNTTGTAVEPGFRDCLNGEANEVCVGSESCVFDDGSSPSVGVCAAMDCADASECPDAPATGTAMPACTNVAVPDGNECILDCSGGETCPDGMICYGEQLCMWAQHGLAVENFTDGIPASWTLHDVDGHTPNSDVSFIDEAWVAAMVSGGNVVAVSTSWYEPPGTANDWLVSPPIALGEASTLEFVARAPDMDFPDGYQVRISTTGTDVADFMVDPPLLDIAGEEDSFTSHTIDLAAEGYASETVWIAWRNDSNDKYLLQVDDIEVTY